VPFPTILFVTHDATLTGAPLLLREIIRSLRETLQIEAVVAIRDNLAGAPLRGDFAQLGRVICEWESHEWPERIDLIYSNTCSNGLYVAALGRLYPNAPVVTHIHELTDSILSFGRNNWEAVARQSGCYIASAAPARRHLVHNFHIPPERVFMVPPFCSPTKIDQLVKAPTTAMNAEIATIDGCYVIGGAGWATFRKGVDFFLKLLDSLPERIMGRPVRLAWVGGNIEPFLATLTEADRGRVVAFGVQKNPFPFLSRCDVLAVTSREDTGPMVLFEAAYLRVPVVGFAGTGSIDDMAAQGGGLTVPPFDDARFASALLALAYNDSYRKRMAERGRSIVKEQFSDVACLPRISDVVGKILRDGIPRPLSPETPSSNIWKEGMVARLLPAREGMAQVFFGGKGLHSNEVSFDRHYPAEIVFRFQEPDRLRHLRLDPDVAPGHFAFHEIVLRSADGVILMDLGTTHPWSAAIVAGTALALSAEGGLSILSFGEDPQIILPLPEAPAAGDLELRVRLSADYSSSEFGRLLTKFGRFSVSENRRP
jgi:glycosyltransferase involved in cell wall biosynthesis